MSRTIAMGWGRSFVWMVLMPAPTVPPPVFVEDHGLLVIFGPAIEPPPQAANILLCGADPTTFYASCRSLYPSNSDHIPVTVPSRTRPAFPTEHELYSNSTGTGERKERMRTSRPGRKLSQRARCRVERCDVRAGNRRPKPSLRPPFR